MSNKIFYFIIIILLTNFVWVRAEEFSTIEPFVKTEKDMEIVEIPAVYIQTSDKSGHIRTEKLTFTQNTKRTLVKSLEQMISIFEEVNKSLKRQKSEFRIYEVEINASLEGKTGLFKMIEGGAQGSLKIILRPR
mgnify:CR=1 FL=1